MAQRATIEQLRKSRHVEVEVEIDGQPATFEIAKIKVGQRRRVSTECFDEHGMPDLEKASMLAAEFCVVDPKLSADDVENIDIDVFLQLADHIAEHSGLVTIAKLVTPDPEEGSDAVKSFPAAG